MNSETEKHLLNKLLLFDSLFTIHVSRFLLDDDCFAGADIGSFSAITGIALIADYISLLVPEFEDFWAYFNA